MNIRLSFLYLTRSPLSHIAETISTSSFLVEHPIIQPDGSVERVFSYSGNAVRGQWRDLSAVYLLEKLGSPQVPPDGFHLLFSGGAIGGEQQTDIAAARKLRSALPHLSLLGGGVGNQILSGKLRVSCLYPVCAEAMPCLPDDLLAAAERIRYKALTFEQQFSRKDDSKDVKLIPYIIQDAEKLLAGPKAKKKTDSKSDDDEDKTQQRMLAELVAPGVHLYGECDCLGVSEVELGCLVAALHMFGRSPVLGGQGNKGHGRVTVDVRYTDLDSGESGDFLSIKAGAPPLLAGKAESAKAAYDQHLRAQYDQMLAANGGEIKQLLGAASS